MVYSVYELFNKYFKKIFCRGGPECASHISYDIHCIECFIWTLISIFLYYIFDIPKTLTEILLSSNYIKAHSHMKGWRVFDYIFGLIHMTLWLQVLYYKINLKSLVNLLQPCHLALLFEGIAVLLTGPTSKLCSLVALPITFGAIGALMHPATEGLDQPLEEAAFFVQV